jgi:DNA-binding response OmpR family regulator
MSAKILLVEDNNDIMTINSETLEMEGHTVFMADTLAKARELFSTASPDIIVLDIMMPDGSGLDFCNELRKKYTVPIIFLTCMNYRQTIIDGLRTGGDDYLTKPYYIDELIARIESLLRRIKIERRGERKEIGHFVIDTALKRVYFRQDDVLLKPKEFLLFMHLLNNENIGFTAEELYTAVWGASAKSDIRTVRVHIASIRKKLHLDDDVGITIETRERKFYSLTKTNPFN